MASKKKTWLQKWTEAKSKPDLPKIFDCEKSGLRMAIPSGSDIEAIVRRSSMGQIVTVGQITDELATKYHVDKCCPLVTGIFLWLMSSAADEIKDDSLPWWRVVKAKGELNPKFPNGPELQKALLESEGHAVVAKGKKWFVQQANG